MADDYHHGDLRRTLLGDAATIAADSGVEAVTLRALARAADVSHSAPVHHFGTRRGLLTALAAEGFALLAEAVSGSDDLAAAGEAYLDWALAHPGHYAVMWQQRALDADDPDLRASQQRAWRALGDAVREESGARSTDGPDADAYAAFALVHGLASMWLSGAAPMPDRREDFTSAVLQRLAIARD